MTVRYTYLTKDGTPLADGEELTRAQIAFQVLLEGGLGVPVLDRNTLDEFVRRADLFQTYISVLWSNGDGTPRILHREDWVELLPRAGSNWGKIGKADFDRSMKKRIDAYWESVDRREREAKG